MGGKLDPMLDRPDLSEWWPEQVLERCAQCGDNKPVPPSRAQSHADIRLRRVRARSAARTDR